MTGFFLDSENNRIEVRYCSEPDITGVAIDVINDGPIDYYSICITDPEELEELIAHLIECKDKLKFNKQ